MLCGVCQNVPKEDAGLHSKLEELAEQVRLLKEVGQQQQRSMETDDSTCEEDLKGHGKRLDDLDDRVRGLEVKSSLKQTLPRGQPVPAEGSKGLDELRAEVMEWREETRASMEDIEILLSGSKRASMEAEAAASEAQEGMEKVAEKVAELTKLLQAQEAQLAELKEQGGVEDVMAEVAKIKLVVADLRETLPGASGGEKSSSLQSLRTDLAAVRQDVAVSTEAREEDAMRLEGLEGTVEALKAGVTDLRKSADRDGPRLDELESVVESLRAPGNQQHSESVSRSMDLGEDRFQLEGKRHQDAELQGLVSELLALKASVASLRASQGQQHMEAPVTQEELEGIIDGLSDALMSEIEELRSTVSELKEGGRRDVDPIMVEALSSEVEAVKEALQEVRAGMNADSFTMAAAKADADEAVMAKYDQVSRRLASLAQQSEKVMAEMESLHSLVQAFEARGVGSGAPAQGEDLRQLHLRIEELEASAFHSNVLASEVDAIKDGMAGLQGFGTSGLPMEKEEREAFESRLRALEAQIEQSDMMAAELEAVKASVMGLEAGEAGQALDRTAQSVREGQGHQEALKVRCSPLSDSVPSRVSLPSALCPCITACSLSPPRAAAINLPCPRSPPS